MYCGSDSDSSVCSNRCSSLSSHWLRMPLRGVRVEGVCEESTKDEKDDFSSGPASPQVRANLVATSAQDTDDVRSNAACCSGCVKRSVARNSL